MKAAVYLGSRPGKDEKYKADAMELGRLLARNNIEVIYGGARVGTMGALAEGVLAGKGSLIAVFPKGFKGRKDYAKKGMDVRLQGDGFTYLETPTFDERIRKMEELSDLCIVLPGSYGTMHEFFSYFEGNELDRFNKPIAILNTNGYYDPLLQLIRNMVEMGFTDDSDKDLFLVATSPEELVEKVLAYFR